MPAEQNFTIHPDAAIARAAAEQLFTRITSALRELLPASAEIRHIGATAISGCLTKGDLDIVVRVEQEHFAGADELLADRFARNTGSVRTDSFSAFEDTETSPPLGVQLTAIDGPYDDFHLFVEALLRDPRLVTAYNELKSRFEGQPMQDYRAAKDAFIAEVLASTARPAE
jgi:GrpB-like predicted nucleotidyltransferase (UPF0157 family)